MKRVLAVIFCLWILMTALAQELQAAEAGAITITVTIAEAEIIEATVEFRPKIIRLPQRYIRGYIELPLAYRVENIMVGTIALTEVNGNPISPPLKTIGRSRIADFDRDGIFDLEVRFDIRTIILLLKTGVNTLTITGSLIEGKTFKGTGTISVIKRR